MKRRFKRGVAQFVNNVDRYFQEYIELVPAITLLIFGIITMLPKEFLPGGGSAYVSSLAKLPFGLFMFVPSVTIVYLHIKHNILDYRFRFKELRKRVFFYITVNFIYLGALSAFISAYPPRFVLFFAVGVVSLFCYLRLARR
jgi:hypothetical protein